MPACGYEFYLLVIISCNSISHSLAALTRRYRVEHSKIKLVSACGHVISSIYRGFYWKNKQIGPSVKDKNYYRGL